MNYTKTIFLITLTGAHMALLSENSNPNAIQPINQSQERIEKPSLVALSAVFAGRYLQGLVYPLIRYNAPAHRSEGPGSVIWPEVGQEIAKCKKAAAEKNYEADRHLTYASCAGLLLGIATLTAGTCIALIKVVRFFKNI